MPVKHSEQCVAQAKSSANVSYCYYLALCTRSVTFKKISANTHCMPGRDQGPNTGGKERSGD